MPGGLPVTDARGRVAQVRTTLRRVSSSSIAKGSLANFVGLAAYTLLQLISVPVLSHAFGLEGYGIWVLLWTVPTYLALADLGLTNAAANEVAARWGAGDTAGMQKAFQSISSVALGIASGVAILTALIVVGTSLVDGVWSPGVAPYRVAIVALSCWFALTMICQSPAAVLRGTGHYVRGNLLFDGASSLDSIALLIAAALTDDINSTALALLIPRVATTLLLIWQMQHHTPVRFGLAHASLAEVRRLLPSAIGSLVIPMAIALSLQGSLLLIGWAFGPAAVALIVPARTLSRIGLQLMALINRATLPELAAAHGRQDAPAQLRLWRWNRHLTAALLGGGGILFALLGSWIVRLWTGGLIDTPPVYIVLLAASMAFNGWWYFGLWMLTATHSHTRRTPHIFLGTLFGLLLGFALVPVVGIPGVLLGVLAGDVVLVIVIEAAIREELRGLRFKGQEAAAC